MRFVELTVHFHCDTISSQGVATYLVPHVIPVVVNNDDETK